MNYIFHKKFRNILFNFLFIILILDCIVDPSDTIFKLKVILLLSNLIIGFLTFKPKIKIIIFSLFVSLIFPFLFFLIGLINKKYYNFDVALSQWKPYLFFSLLPFIVKSYLKIYSNLTYVLIVITSLVFYFVIFENIFIIEPYIGNYENTMKIARRDFGNQFFLMVYHNSVSLLIFGFSISLFYFQNSYKYKFLLFFSIIILFFSSTRANWIALFLVFSFHVFQQYIVYSLKFKYLLILLSSLILIFILPKLFFVLFSNEENSLSDKISFIDDYLNHWTSEPLSFLFGQGFGNGINTSLRGVTYNLETTFFEILRIYGIFGTFLFFLFFMYPLYFFLKFKYYYSNYKIYYYLFYTYLIYFFIIIPSNPLLFSSNGFLLLLVFYSEILNFKKIVVSRYISLNK